MQRVVYQEVLMQTLFLDCRLPDGTAGDILVNNGIVTDIRTDLAAQQEDADIIDVQGALVLPGLVDGHAHLDKTLMGLPWLPHPAEPERQSRIETEKRLRAEFPLSVKERAANLIPQAVALGTTAIRTHVDIDPAIGLANLHGILAAKEAFKEHVDIQIVAFPQSGVMGCPGTAELLEAAIQDGADLVGGIDPLTLDGDLDGQLDTLFGIAERRGVGIDVHIHDAGPNGLVEITAMAERVSVYGITDCVTVSHGFCLGGAGEADLERVANLMANNGMTLVTHGGGASPLPPVKWLRDKGITVFAGNDNVRDTWSPYGNGDMLERAMLVAWRAGFRTDADLALAFDTASSAGAQALGLEGYGLTVGCRADFFCVASETLAEAIVNRPARALVVKSGRLVARDGELLLPSP
jgi:cytosine deaminase